MTSSPKIDEELIQILKGSADSIYALFESLGPDVAKKARELRAINARLIKAASESASTGTYYRKFAGEPLEAVLVHLFASGSPMRKSDVAREIVLGGFISDTRNGPKGAILESIYFQTKQGKNGRLKVEDIGDGIIKLTPEGEADASELIKKYGSPDL
jgi:hypothetical protein